MSTNYSSGNGMLPRTNRIAGKLAQTRNFDEYHVDNYDSDTNKSTFGKQLSSNFGNSFRNIQDELSNNEGESKGAQTGRLLMNSNNQGTLSPRNSNKEMLGISRRVKISSRQASQRKSKLRDSYDQSNAKSLGSSILATTGQNISAASDYSNLPLIGQSSGQSFQNSQQNSQIMPSRRLAPLSQASGHSSSNLLSTSNSTPSAIPAPVQYPAVSHHQSLQTYNENHTYSSCTTIRGLKPGNPNWTNQDNFFIHESPNNRDNGMFCILDGHGENGHLVSKRCREVFPQFITHANYDTKKAFNSMQSDLCSCEFDVRCSGATCIVAVLAGNKLIVSNCGDSRGVLGKKASNGALTAVALTNDHKPDKADERKRILGCGGHLGCRQVLVNQPGRGPVSMPVGPCRVWYQHRGETLGLAMSRSLGDSIVHKSGVSAEPEIIEHIVDDSDEFFIMATDGVWDVVDNNQAVQLVHSFVSKSGECNTLEASAALCKYARGRWEKMSPMIDDITCIVINLKR